jgi:hypothetical protein
MKKIFILPLLALLFLSACSSNGDDDTPDPTDDEPVVVDKSQNLLATGASANDLLSNANFDRLLVQAAFVTGFRPTAETMNNFVQYIREHTFKQNIDIEYLELESPGEEDLALQEIADLESENRTAYNDGTTLAIYIYFADAPSEGDDLDEGLVTLGAVYRNTSMVIFERTIRTLAGRSLLITNTDVETATLNHEFGHLFGLVNLGTVPVNDHEDPDAESHCVVEGCLMRAELVFQAPTAKTFSSHSKNDVVSACSLSGHSVLHLLESRAVRGQAVVPGLDTECILDLQNNGGR